MKRLQKPPVAEAKTSKKEPLAEGLQVNIPTGPKGRRLWRKTSDGEVVEIAKKVMENKGISKRRELIKTDSGLYRVLRKRGLFDKVGFEKKLRSWRGMSDEEIVKYARKMMEENEITGRRELKKADSGLYTVLREIGLLDKVGFVDKRRKKRSWKEMSDEKIVEFTRRLMEEKKITGRSELEKADSGLYTVLRERRLLGKIKFEQKKRFWRDLGDEEIIELARRLMKEKGVSSKSELKETDKGVYIVLLRRGLIDNVGFEEKRRSWEDMSDEEVVEFARKVMKEKDITRRRELEKDDYGLYSVLKKRGLLDEVGFEEKQRKYRSWKDMSDEEVVEFARKVMKEKDITGREELKKADCGLYQVLRKKGLLNHAFARIDQQRTNSARDAVIDALTKFAATDEKPEVGVA
ncbi:hypothetical protein KKE38_03745 [Candidatus Micrarchaeota archaeon]|nr:hypothetical protein [Candidatus Micrarchaeota archaeon]